MAGRWDCFQGLPHGWEVRFDGRVGRYYFIDHLNKKTSWEDPRLKSAPPPPPHPESGHSEIKSRQESQSVSHHPNVSHATEPPPLKKSVGGHPSPDVNKGRGSLTSQQESGLLEAVEHSQLAIAKISAMFPTVPESHIKDLMRKYLKGIFPKVEPTIILDVLTQCNYNVKDTCEKLVLLGYDKKDTVLAPPKLKDRPDGKENKAVSKPSPGPARPKNLSEKHKKKVRNELTSGYPDLTPTVVTMALQSVYYDENRARQVLDNMVESDKKTQEALASCASQMPRSTESKTVTLNLMGSPPLARRDGVKPTRPTLPRTRINTAWTAAQTVSRGTNTEEDLGFRSDQRMRPQGPNTKLHKGPSECLLLSDYQAWHGPNPDNASGSSKSLAQGPRSTHLRGPSGIARGHDPAMRKGPQGLAKGSQFTQGIKKEVCLSTKVL
ncbi:hypothetical protein O3P69_008374 [Scylla paramamosain]|uniref:WW domain-containing protein n=1 Tax=Scylla paramamosain TaxID=85552 RepID=A0AAW0SJI1_SCYPA